MAQLKAFQAGLAKLSDASIGIVSLSADLRAQAEAVVADHRLEFPVACGASVDVVADAVGVYYDPHPPHTTPYLQSAGFVLGPESRHSGNGGGRVPAQERAFADRVLKMDRDSLETLVPSMLELGEARGAHRPVASGELAS